MNRDDACRLRFDSKTSYYVGGRKVLVVENPEKCDNFKHLLNRTVVVDGEEVFVTGVESRCHGAPWKQGEDIGLMTAERGEL